MGIVSIALSASNSVENVAQRTNDPTLLIVSAMASELLCVKVSYDN